MYTHEQNYKATFKCVQSFLFRFDNIINFIKRREEYKDINKTLNKVQKEKCRSNKNSLHSLHSACLRSFPKQNHMHK